MRFLPILLTSSIASVGMFGCGGAASSANKTARPLPAYSGHATELFDDDIEPRAVGIDLSLSQAQANPRSDSALRERAQVGDAVVRARVDTVTAKNDGVDARYDLGLRPIEKIAGEHPPAGENFNLRIERTGPAANIVKNFQNRLHGRIFVVFVREFVRPDGDTELHFHAAPDNKDVVDAVRAAAAFGEGTASK
ncbi:hypothetical protein LVJ94_15550 [Pendulispora rubella]|uniref:Lipoprotein n=1 Tax=Pendulispora rubella TaxID=2741070 RepID=A0ABZ2LCJ1_9BACT